LGVGGSIAAYKAVELASLLRQRGAAVRAALSANAAEFVTALTFRTISGYPVLSDGFKAEFADGKFWDHTQLADWGDALCVAPASCNVIAKLAHGMADDALTAVALAFNGARLLAPAMETNMYNNPAVGANLTRLKEYGWHIVGPASGRLASGKEGPGRMVEPFEIYENLCWLLGKHGDLAGRKVVVTAGGTRERLDAVRHLSNSSSGKMGYALATAARDRGAEVVLISTVCGSPAPAHVRLEAVASAADMLEAVNREAPSADLLLMAAAVADFRIKNGAAGKLSKDDIERGDIAIELNPDIVAQARGANLVKIPFAAAAGGGAREQEKVAAAKARAKGAPFVALNDIADGVSGFGSDQSQVKLVGQNGDIERLPVMSKAELSHRIISKALKFIKGD